MGPGCAAWCTRQGCEHGPALSALAQHDPKARVAGHDPLRCQECRAVRSRLVHAKHCVGQWGESLRRDPGISWEDASSLWFVLGPWVHPLQCRCVYWLVAGTSHGPSAAGGGIASLVDVGCGGGAAAAAAAAAAAGISIASCGDAASSSNE